MATFLFSGVLLIFIFIVQASHSADRVTSLPGFDGVFASDHYAGYITIDEVHGKNLYYYFVTSEGSPRYDPVVLWLNGGPGCSSFDGFVYEHGPFRFEPNGSERPRLRRNPDTWTRVANIIYLDSPVGVGFSYSSVSSDYITGDIQTAKDSHSFLLKWFQQYPEYLSNPLYIIGESYAGVYVPTLAQETANGIRDGLQPTLNLRGYAIGNGVTDNKFDGDALVPFAFGMGLISIDLYTEVHNACNGSYWNSSTESCDTLLDKIDQELSNLNIYDILEPCFHDPPLQQTISLPSSFRMLGETERSLPVRKRMFGRAWPLHATVKEGYVPNWRELTGKQHVPCLDVHIADTWLNDPDVRKALHARPEDEIGRWYICTDQLKYHHDAGSMLPFHHNLHGNGYRALIYSGDHDMCVPYTGSEAWTRALGYEVVDEWRPWLVGDQVAGYTRGYANLTFATVKGSGHTVPEYKPREGLALLRRWIQGKPL